MSFAYSHVRNVKFMDVNENAQKTKKGGMLVLLLELNTKVANVQVFPPLSQSGPSTFITVCVTHWKCLLCEYTAEIITLLLAT